MSRAGLLPWRSCLAGACVLRLPLPIRHRGFRGGQFWERLWKVSEGTGGNSLLYWGGALPLAWALWEQNTPQPPGHYWAQFDPVLAAVAALLPAGVEVVLVGDRAYDVAAFVERLERYGWHWGIRAKARGALRVRDRRGREHRLRDLVRQHLPRPGTRWKGRGQIFKDAGWLPAEPRGGVGGGGGGAGGDPDRPAAALDDAPSVHDYVAQRGQGVIAHGVNDRLGRSDVAVIHLRHLFEREMTALAEGRPLTPWAALTPMATSGMKA